MRKQAEIQLYVDPLVYISLALVLLIVPVGWSISWVVASLFHEFGHCLSVLLCGKRIHGISVSTNGALIQAEPMEPWETLFCALAGPIMGILPVLFSGLFPKVAVCAFVLSAYNMLPIYPLDGSRVLRELVGLLSTERIANKLCMITEILFISAAAILSLIGLFWWNLGVIPVLVAVTFLIRTKKIKIPCKPRLHNVQ